MVVAVRKAGHRNVRCRDSGTFYLLLVGKLCFLFLKEI